MPAWDAVIFDLDDTLYPEAEFVRSGFQAISHWIEHQWGFPANTTNDQLLALQTAGHHGSVFNRWLHDRGYVTSQWVPVLVDLYRGHVPQINPFPGIPELLVDLRRCLPLGLVSDGNVGQQRSKLQALQLADHFRAVVFSDEFGVEFRKPHPKPFERVLAQMGVSPARAVYVGDNPHKDFVGCRSLGMHTTRLRIPGGVYHDLEATTPAHHPHETVDSIESLRGYLFRSLGRIT